MCQRMKKLQNFIILTYLIIYVTDEFIALRAALIISPKGIEGAVKVSGVNMPIMYKGDDIILGRRNTRKGTTRFERVS